MHDPKGGYYKVDICPCCYYVTDVIYKIIALTVNLYSKGPTGTFRDHIDPEMTTREAVVVAREEAKRQWGLLKEDFVYYHTRRERLEGFNNPWQDQD